MYVVTFYSFKGGVGRSMALVNVAAELTKRGKRVLIVDFDLEAPGLDTFDLTRSDDCKRGLLDFVCDFRDTAEVPDVKGYVYKTGVDLGTGELWVMPAGLQDEGYDHRFRSMDWADLYARHNGFLLFEDLKVQWRDALEMDYVLIDSRTGHTDVGGICTRQLPEAVVAFFFPNEQNRRGLQSVVSQIRDEVTGPLKKRIDLHFVMSNVPDLDDEDEILEREIKQFEKSLSFASPSAVIHHYDSLALLEQVTFVKERPRSRLAKEYAELAVEIVRRNIEDREGALAFLDQVGQPKGRIGSVSDLETQLQEIRMKHSHDAGVLHKLSGIKARQRKIEEALAISTEAVNADANDSDLYLARAQLYALLGKKEGTVADLKKVLAMPDPSSFDLAVTLRMLRETQPDLVQLVSRSPALDRIEPDLDLIQELDRSPETLSSAVQLLTRWLSARPEEPLGSLIKNSLILCLIGQGAYKDAMHLFGDTRLDPTQVYAPDSFNYAMALLGHEGVVPLDHFRHAADLLKRFKGPKSPNYFQCVALANALIGNEDVAKEFILTSREANVAMRASSFSCWSYLEVSVERFMSDLDQLQLSLEAGQIVPEFIRRNSSGYPSQVTIS
jgi:MinD-like ATPase involved in chromosome partitioning or flagellar assembly